jgi:hypothetical protein
MRLAESQLWTRGRAYGFAGSMLLLLWFIVPAVSDLANRPCDLAPRCPAPIERGVLPVLVIAGLYCLLVGYFISHIIDQGPQDRRTALVAFVLALTLFGGFLWVMMHAAFR